MRSPLTTARKQGARIRATTFLAFCFVLFGSAAAPAGAHVDKVSSCPAAREVVSTLAAIDIVFDGPLLVSPERPAKIQIRPIDGQPVPQLDPTQLTDVTTISAVLATPLQLGVYDVSYDVISFDGDLNSGSFEFRFDESSADATNCAASVVDEGSGTLGWLLFALPLVLLLAGAFFVQRWSTRRAAEFEAQTQP